MNQDPPILNEDRFRRMACGDMDSFYELAGDYFEEVESRIPEWRKLNASGDDHRLREEFHRSKGGAAIFGFERLHAHLTSLEKQIEAGGGEVDIDQLLGEYENAKQAVAALQVGN
ncbi:Hpt domain-containing protein [Luteolibacter pohnpeiensis]|uniref:Hpt domain-containing protein n=1 Tax=Luteolibacter pohnpeiensis TaxID=454153 RepID=A0A934S9G9_9BACT|nr:Hpt domain-containing protein [Luteolibacter pohnpeiensis]MBK1883336.1 Hpt domain-containing protein [Luteolibacter pohnpeiensis]